MGLKNLKEVLLKRFLGNFEGILQTDGYAAYGRRGGPTIGACGVLSTCQAQAAVFSVDETFKHWVGWILCCPSAQGAQSGTVLNIIGTGRFRSLRRSIPKVVKSSAEPLSAIPARSSWLFSSRSLLAKPRQREIHIIADNLSAHRTSKRKPWSEIVMFASITHQPTPPGSTKLRSGFPNPARCNRSRHPRLGKRSRSETHPLHP